MFLFTRKICIILSFFALSYSLIPEKAKADDFAYKVGIIAGTEVFNFGNTIIETMNLLNNKEFQEKYGLDKPVIFASEMLPGFILNRKSDIDLIKQSEALQKNPDVDLILIIGVHTARLALQYNKGKKPIFLISEHDFVEMKILPSYDDSGYDNVTAFIKTADLYTHYLRLSGLMDFKKIGTIVLDKENSTSSLYAQRIGELFQDEQISLQEFRISEDSVEAVKLVIPQIIEAKPDALIITGLDSFELNVNAWELFEPLLDVDIPAISPSLQSMAEKGALFSFSMNEGKKRDIFADIMARLLKGENPREIPMQYPYFPELNFNIIVANNLELFLSYEILGACHHFFYSVDTGD